jgi:tetratricopeptide (TPR) repeat protein
MAEREGEVTRVLKRVAQTIDRGKYDQALSELLHLSEKYPDAGDIRPQIAEVFLRRGESRAKRGKLKEARDDFERSLNWARKPGAYVAIAWQLLSEGKLDRADEVLNTALELDDRHGPTHEAIGMLMFKWEEYKEAARAFEQALGLGHGTPTLYRAVWDAYMRQDRLDRAHELICEGADRFPEDDSLQAAAGDSCVYARGDSGNARGYWERAAELNPANFGALFRLAADDASRGDRARALDRLKRCAALDLDRARRMWREDLESPMAKFRDVARDAEFRGALGWQND